MKIPYYAYVVKKEQADDLCDSLAFTLAQSNVPFKVTMESNPKGYVISVECLADLFNTWEELREYVTKLVVTRRVTAKLKYEISSLEEV